MQRKEWDENNLTDTTDVPAESNHPSIHRGKIDSSREDSFEMMMVGNVSIMPCNRMEERDRFFSLLFVVNKSYNISSFKYKTIF